MHTNLTKPLRSAKPRGHPRDSPQVRFSKTLSWLLRHAAQSEGLAMRADGYLRVSELLTHPKLQSLDFASLQEIVSSDQKKRYDLLHEPEPEPDTSETSVGGPTSSSVGTWWIRANQGHSIEAVQVELKPIVSAADIAMAVHGTTQRAWELIRKQGLSKMKRNHIHLAQGVAGDNVVSGMRTSSRILIYIDVAKAMSAGIEFFLSANGVILTAGDNRGFLDPQFFTRVENAKGVPLPDWESGQQPITHVP